MTTTKNKVVSVHVSWRLVGFRIKGFVKVMTWPITFIVAVALASWIFVNSAQKFVGLTWNAELVLRYIDVLKWPIIALVVLLVIRKHLPEIVKRGFEFGLGGGKLKVPPEKGPEPNEQEKEALGKFKDEKSSEPAKDEAKNDAQLDPQLELAFLKIYMNIHGTQLEALQRLLAYSQGLRAERFEDLLTRHQLNAPPEFAYNGVLDLMRYLIGYKLVHYEDSARKFNILPAGARFVKYLADENLLLRHNNL